MQYVLIPTAATSYRQTNLVKQQQKRHYGSRSGCNSKYILSAHNIRPSLEQFFNGIFIENEPCLYRYEQRGVALLPVPDDGEQGDELRFSHACLCSCIHIYSLGAPKTLGPASSAIYLVDGWGCNCTKPKYYTTLQLLLYAGCSRVLWTKIEQ